jgi:hypothetical protein
MWSAQMCPIWSCVCFAVGIDSVGFCMFACWGGVELIRILFIGIFNVVWGSAEAFANNTCNYVLLAPGFRCYEDSCGPFLF